jgi:uncharacterized protein
VNKVKARLIIAALVFAGILVAFWVGSSHSAIAVGLGSYFPRAFAAFALLLAALWFAGFGVAERLELLPAYAKITLAGMLATPYFVLTAGTPHFYWRSALIVTAFPVLIAAFLDAANPSQRITWRDGFVLALIVAAYFLKWFHGIWIDPEVLAFSKLFLADVTAYAFLVIRRIEGPGYSLVPTAKGVAVGLREWLFYLPLALALGLLTGFIHFHPGIPAPMYAAKALLVTFLLIAIPEELFFRAILQNLFETRMPRNAALILAALLFGLSHFNHGAAFNWRYVLLASVAGIFYGRAWRAQRNVFAAVVTHTAVDVVWSLWFR